jgi:phosphohistidine swiveling domain-containing protein
MMNYIQWFMSSDDSCTSGSVHKLGGKAMGLTRLRKADANVPSWFSVTTHSFLEHMEQADLLTNFEDNHICSPGYINEEQALALQQKIKQLRLNSSFVAELAKKVASIGPGPYAVRSSMVDEDSSAFSFAGQLDTFLYQHTIDDVIIAIKACWASSLNSRVLNYRQHAGFDFDLPVMGVIVQQMITGQVSGVSFSAHPITGRRDHTLITANWGLGEGVVSGHCNADEYTCTHGGDEVDVIIAKKDLVITPAESHTTGVQKLSVPTEKQTKRCLTRSQTKQLAREAARLAVFMGCPQDIEWTISQDELFILQARPITSLPNEKNTDGPRHVFDNSNIQESYCGVTTPLTFSFAARAYHSVYNQTMAALGMSDHEIKQHDERHRHMLALIKGRVYYNINNWYRGLLLLPGFGRNKADMEKMMGLTDPVDFIEDQQFSFRKKLQRLPMLYRSALKLIHAISKLDKTVLDWLSDFEKTYQTLDRNAFKQASFSQLMAWLEQLDVEVLNNWHKPIINDFAVMIYNGRLRRSVESLHIDDPEILLQQLLGGEEGIESTEPTKKLMQLAVAIASQPELVESVKSDNYTVVIEQFSDYPEIHSAYHDYIERYGDRTIGELKLETVSLRENPKFVIEVLKNYLTHGVQDYEQLAENEIEKRLQAEQTLTSKLSYLGRFRILKTLQKTRIAIKHRENMRLTRTRAFGLARDLYLALGQRLFEANQLSKPRDIFYLTVEEIRDYYKGRAVTTNLSALTALRRDEFNSYKSIKVPHQLETIGPVYFGNDFQKERQRRVITSDSNTLSGIGCYPGIVEGKLKIITDPRSNLSLNGHILVAERTDPGWTPLFPSCSGILVERGSSLSHSAIIARELGIPAIVGVPNLLEEVNNNDLVRLDGGKGEVTRLEQSTSPTQPLPEEECC